jgi:hypothetical protein
LIKIVSCLFILRTGAFTFGKGFCEGFRKREKSIRRKERKRDTERDKVTRYILREKKMGTINKKSSDTMCKKHTHKQTNM